VDDVMVRSGRNLWARHPYVANELTIGERAADKLKATFGSWDFLIMLNAFIVGWIVLNSLVLHHPFDGYPFILLNLGLSWLAAQQGGALQIAANRGDRLAAETALHTQKNTDEIVAMNRRQLQILEEIHTLRTAVEESNK
jgi:uncharacterized membrane protein